MKIKNIKGTSLLERCVCGTWIDHWKKFSAQQGPICGALMCSNTDVVGAHVIKTSGFDIQHYIYPLCKACNARTEEFEVWDGYQLVAANKAITCEKPDRPFIFGRLNPYA